MALVNQLSALKLRGHKGSVGSIAVDPARGIFATGAAPSYGAESEVRLWDIQTGESLRTLTTGLNAVFSLAFSRDGSRLAVGGGGTVCDGRWVYTGGVEVWILGSKESVARFGSELLFIKTIAFSPDDASILTTNLKSPNEPARADKRRVRLWRSSDFKETSRFGEHDVGISSACFSPGGEYVVFDANQAGAQVVSAADGADRFVRKLVAGLRTSKAPTVHYHEVNSAPLVRIWNVGKRREEPPLELSQGRVEAVAFSPDGSMVGTCGAQIAIWNVAERNMMRKFDQGPRGYSVCLAFSPDNKVLATGGGYRMEPGGPFEDCGVKLWDIGSGALLVFLPHDRPVHSLCFAQDGKRVVAGGESGELVLWNLPLVDSFHELKDAEV